MTTRPTRPLPIEDLEQMRSALEGVADRDRRVIELRYGLGDGVPHSRAEIGKMMGISRERVRQLETRALDRIGGGPPRMRGAAGRADQRAPRRGRGGPPPSRHSFLRSFTLVLLWLRPAHVYELRIRLRQLGLPAATYRLLQSLEREGFLRSSWTPGRGAGPSRRVYSLTALGVEQLRRDRAALAKMAETLELLLAAEELRPHGDGAADGA